MIFFLIFTLLAAFGFLHIGYALTHFLILFCFHVICFTKFPMLFFSIGLITARLICREKKHTYRFLLFIFVKVAALVSFVNMKERLRSYCAVVND